MKRKSLIVIALTLGAFVSYSQEMKLSKLFADHMVLQREMPVRFWGSDAASQTVTVSIDGFETTTQTDVDGNWECLFPAHVAGGPFDVQVIGSSEIKITDVYFGDVWIAGGQSNMEWPVGGNIDNMDAEIADSDYPKIRFFNVPNTVAVTPQTELTGGEWKVANPENIKEFSAVGWFFAKLNHAEKGVPVGVIGSNWGGTPAQTWTPADRLLGVEGYKESAADMLDPNKDWDALFEQNKKNEATKWEMINDSVSFLKVDAYKMDYDDSGWEDVTLPNGQDLTNFVWLRKTVDISSPKAAELALGKLVEYAKVFVNGQLVLEKIWSDPADPIALKKGILVKGENLITIRVINGWDNKAWIGKKDEMYLKIGKSKINLEGTWKYSNTVEPHIPHIERYSWKPGTLFNGMIAPLAGYSIQGAIWYQGESNAGEPEYYRDLFGSMIEDWRIHWRQGNFPFLFVQLANFQARESEPSHGGWAFLREAQTKTLELPNTGMATIIDIGDAEDIHPRNKQDVGQRLWLAAKKVAFGEDLVYSGPTFASQAIKGNQVIISFDNVGMGLHIKGQKLEGFAVAGADKKFYWAQGKIENNQVILTSLEVSEPMYVRYAWANNPACNLYNAEGLPAVPFRTDQ